MKLTPGGTLVVESDRDLRGTLRLVGPDGEEYVRCWRDGFRSIDLEGRRTTVPNVTPSCYSVEVLDRGGSDLDGLTGIARARWQNRPGEGTPEDVAVCEESGATHDRSAAVREACDARRGVPGGRAPRGDGEHIPAGFVWLDGMPLAAHHGLRVRAGMSSHQPRIPRWPRTPAALDT